MGLFMPIYLGMHDLAVPYWFNGIWSGEFIYIQNKPHSCLYSGLLVNICYKWYYCSVSFHSQAKRTIVPCTDLRWPHSLWTWIEGNGIVQFKKIGFIIQFPKRDFRVFWLLFTNQLGSMRMTMKMDMNRTCTSHLMC